MAPPFVKKGKGGGKGVKKEIEKKKGRGLGNEGLITEDITIDEDARYEGKVINYNKSGGFGFLKPDEAGLIPKDEIMVYWKELQSDDRWPCLDRDMKVEFGIRKFDKKDGSGCFLKAKEVCLVGGERISIQSEKEDKKEYVGGDKNLRYTGKVKWFSMQKGFGFVALDEGFDVPEDVPTEIRITRDEIASGDDAPRLRNDMEVEFGISKNKNGKFSCFNLTLPGGDVISKEEVDQRKPVGTTTYNGKVKFINWGQGWIEFDDLNKLSADLKKKLQEMTEKREKDGKSRDQLIYFTKRDCTDSAAKVDRDMPCKFKIYEDFRGIGAFNISF